MITTLHILASYAILSYVFVGLRSLIEVVDFERTRDLSDEFKGLFRMACLYSFLFSILTFPLDLLDMWQGKFRFRLSDEDKDYLLKAYEQS
jgi:hypothetical protein